jgi:DNA-binding CsgD family transcriptional regulator
MRAAIAEQCVGLLGTEPDASLAAAERLRGAGRPFWLAQAVEDAAIVLARRGDARAARAAYGKASALYTELAAAGELRRAEIRLRRHGVHRRGDRRARAATGWDALTPAELRVARLVAEGRANPDIAAGLFLSRRTVEVHVSHILTKLGARSRVEIARQAIRHLALPIPA